jgi:recombination protein RecA
MSGEVDRKALLMDTVNKINKKFGANTVVVLGADAVRQHIDVIPTQSLLLNYALGIGGLPKGRITEIYGPAHSGKSGICLGVVAECQKLGQNAAWIDAENALDPDYARLLGVNLDDLFYCQPSSGEEAINIAEALIRSGGLDLLVIDSVAALVPTAEVEAEMEQNLVGTHARLMSKALRKLIGAVAKNNVALVFINQVREKVGVMYANPETPTGGNALRFYASVRIEVRRGEEKKQGDEIVGQTLRCRVVKNRLAIPFRRCEFPVYYGKGVDRVYELFELGVHLGVIKRSGSWYALEGYGQDGLLKVNTRDGFMAVLREDGALQQYLEERIRPFIGRAPVAPESDSA